MEKCVPCTEHGSLLAGPAAVGEGMGEVVGLLALHTAGGKPFFLLRGRAAHPRVVPKARREGLAASEGAGKEGRSRPVTQAARPRAGGENY